MGDSVFRNKMAGWASSDPNGCDQQKSSYVSTDQQEGNTSLLRHCGFLENAMNKFQSGCKPSLSSDPGEV